ncbi:MAG: hypothetical protein IJJ31_01700 [Mogibacterium sp.]|nr:hypothetical protein [Mogibacterium sp.]
MTRTITAGSTIAGGSLTSTGGIKAAAKGKIRRTSRNMFLAVSAVVLAVFILVGLSAYAASIQHANNELIQENEYLQAEIDSFRSQIIEETKITRVEEIAKEEYGMVYQTSENCIVINESEEGSHNLAASIKSEAYN